MSDLPAGWTEVTLGDVAISVKNGIFVSRPGSEPSGVPILRISAVRPGILQLDDIRYSGLSADELSQSDALLEEEDLLFTRYNGNVDYVGACGMVPPGIGNLTYPDKLIRVRVDNQIVEPSYVRLAFEAPQVRARVRSVARTTAGQAGISGSSLRGVTFPLPPIKEQRRIVASLEDHLSCLDQAKSYISSGRRRLRIHRREVEERGVRGQLIVAKRSEGIPRQLEEILTSRKERAKTRRLVPAKPAYDDLEIPDHWAVASVDQLCWSLEYGTSAKTGAQNDPADIPVVRMGNIQDGNISMASLKYLPADHPGIQDLLLKEGDVLFNRTDSAELVGKSATYRGHVGPATFASYLIRCRLLEGTEPGWLALVINSSVGRKYIQAVMSQQARARQSR